jgi:hypothetical protein
MDSLTALFAKTVLLFGSPNFPSLRELVYLVGSVGRTDKTPFYGGAKFADLAPYG